MQLHWQITFINLGHPINPDKQEKSHLPQVYAACIELLSNIFFPEVSLQHLQDAAFSPSLSTQVKSTFH